MNDTKLTVGSLFAGIGGFDLGLERAGFKTKWQVEIDEWCRQVLTKHWPEVPKYADIKECGRHNLAPVDLICGGFPCQPFSVAGQRRGTEDDRHLWPEMLRVIKEIRPSWVIGENVAGLVNMAEPDSESKVESRSCIRLPDYDVFEKIFTQQETMLLNSIIEDLEEAGYRCAPPFIIPACALDAPHRRDRIWIVGHSISNGRKSRGEDHREYDGAIFTSNGKHADFLADSDNAPGERHRQHSGQVLSISETKRFSKSGIDVSDTNKQHDDDSGYGASSVLRTGQKTSDLSRSEGSLADSESKYDGRSDTGKSCGQIQQPGVGSCEADVPNAGHTKSQGWKKEEDRCQRTTCRKSPSYHSNGRKWPVEPGVGRVADGIPRRVDRLRGLGNAVTPDIPEVFGSMILKVEKIINEY